MSRFLKMAAAAILDFWHFKLLTVGRVISVEMRYRGTFCGDRLNFWRDIAIFGFYKMASVCHLGFVMRLFTSPTKITVYNLVEIGVVYSLEDMWVSILCKFGLKMLIYAPFGGFGAHFPRIMSLVVLTAKRTILGLNHVIWAINREYRSRGSSWAREREKSQKGYI